MVLGPWPRQHARRLCADQKIWIPVYTQPGKSGLLLFPDSHNRDDIRFEGVYRNGYTKPSLVSDLSGEKRVLFSGSNGELVIFNDRTLHGRP